MNSVTEYFHFLNKCCRCYVPYHFILPEKGKNYQKMSILGIDSICNCHGPMFRIQVSCGIRDHPQALNPAVLWFKLEATTRRSKKPIGSYIKRSLRGSFTHSSDSRRQEILHYPDLCRLSLPGAECNMLTVGMNTQTDEICFQFNFQGFSALDRNSP